MWFLPIGLSILALDQWTKHLVRSQLYPNESLPVIPGFFNLVHVQNDGAAWNMLSGQSVVLISISVLALLLLFIFRSHFLRGRFLDPIFLGLLFGGITGNLIDRVLFGQVTDFLDFYIGTHHYPSFNVADSAICVSLFGFILLDFITKKPASETPSD